MACLPIDLIDSFVGLAFSQTYLCIQHDGRGAAHQKAYATAHSLCHRRSAGTAGASA